MPAPPSALALLLPPRPLTSLARRTDAIDKHTIYPYVHSFSNIPSNAALLRPITIPDVLPASLPEGADFSLVAG